MHGCYTPERIRILGARLHIHWPVGVAASLIFASSWRQPLHAVLAVLSYFGIILLHEVGHAAMAMRLGYQPLNIYLSLCHGRCECEFPRTLREQAIVAWGGVLAQFAIAVPLIFLNTTTQLGSVPYFGTLIGLLGYFSLLVALMNLAPARGLDGALAWQLVPILIREARARFNKAKQTKRSSAVRRIR